MRKPEYTKLVGVKFDGRQGRIKKCIAGDVVNMVREPDNEYDPHAIRVERGGDDIGYINADLARELAPYLDNGNITKCTIEQVTGGNDYWLGVNIHIEYVDVM